MSVRTSFAVAVLAAVLAVSTPARADQKAAEAPIPAPILSLMTAKDTTPSAPVLVRVYKKESELEVWKKAAAMGHGCAASTAAMVYLAGEGIAPDAAEARKLAERAAELNDPSGFVVLVRR